MSVKRIYEAMFLFDPTAGSSWEHVEEVIKRLMERAEGELIRMKKWDERRMAYEIEGRKRGVYVLAFFKAPTENIHGLERDVQLSDEIIRVLVLCRQDYTVEQASEIVEKAQAYTPPMHYGEGFGYGERTERGGYRDHGPVESVEPAEIAEGDEADVEIPEEAIRTKPANH